MKLEFDSTVNYALDRASIATTAADRANPSPYNTYGAGPAADPDLLAGAGRRRRRSGPGRGLVAVLRQGRTSKGESCFSITVEQHDACVAQARANGVFG